MKSIEVLISCRAEKNAETYQTITEFHFVVDYFHDLKNFWYGSCGMNLENIFFCVLRWLRGGRASTMEPTSTSWMKLWQHEKSMNNNEIKKQNLEKNYNR